MINYFIKAYKYLAQEKVNFSYNLKLKKLISETNIFLSNGTYKLLTGGKVIIYQENEETLSFIKKHHWNLSKNYRKRFIHLLDPLFKFKVRGLLKENFSGQLIMVTLDKDIKIFDFNTEKVLTIYKNEEKFSRIKLATKTLDPFFNLTTIRFYEEKYHQIEELINQKPGQKCYDRLTEIEKDQIFQSLILQYTNYFNHLKDQAIQYITLEKIREQLRSSNIKEEVCKRLERILFKSSSNLLLPRVFLHGDLHYGNLLLDNEMIKLIDFECAGSFIFIYDLLNFIYEETVTQNNYYFLEAYNKGKYDDLWNSLFEQIGMVYDNNKKIEYLTLFLI